MMRLNRADWHIDDVIDLDQLFDQEWLAVLHVDHVAVVAGEAIHLILELLES